MERVEARFRTRNRHVPAPKLAVFVVNRAAAVCCIVLFAAALAPADQFFVHQSNASNILSNQTFVESVSTNGNQAALLFVTPDLTDAARNDHPIGVLYDRARLRWAIFNEDGSPMPPNARFHVAVITNTSAGTTFVRSDGLHGNTALISRQLGDGHPDAMIFATANYNPSGSPEGVNNPHPIGVYYDPRQGHWSVFNQLDAVPRDYSMHSGASFNVMIEAAGQQATFVHRATSANRVLGATVIDSPHCNGLADAILVVTPNWNPTGSVGVYDRKNIAVFFNTPNGRWIIMHQDGSPIPENAAFNVRVFRSGGSTNEIAYPGRLHVTDISPDSPFGTPSPGDDPAGMVVGIAAAPDGRTLYAASEYAGVWKSSDAGHSWTQFGNGLLTGHSWAQPAIAVDASNPNSLMYGTNDSDWFPNSEYGGLWVSTNGANNWRHVTLPSCPQPIGVKSLVFFRGSAHAATRCGVAVGDSSLTTWTMQPTPVLRDILSPDPPPVLSVLSAGNQSIFGCAQGNSQIFRSDSYGQFRDRPIRIPGTCISLAAVPLPGHDLVAVIYSNGKGSQAEVAIIDFDHNRIDRLGFNHDQIGSGVTRVFAVRRPDAPATSSEPGTAFDVFATNQLQFFQFHANGDWRAISGVHNDTRDMAFSPAYNPSLGNCTVFLADDGGIHASTRAGGAACQTSEGPWVRASTGLHGLKAGTMTAISQPWCGTPLRPCAALYVPSGDNGTWVNLTGGLPNTSWTHLPCCGDTGFALSEPGNPAQIMTGRNQFRTIVRSGTSRPPAASDSQSPCGTDEMPDGFLHGDYVPGNVVAQVQAVRGEGDWPAPNGDYIGFRSRAAFPDRPGGDLIVRLRNGCDWQVISAQPLNRGTVIELGVTGGHRHPTVYVLTSDRGILVGHANDLSQIHEWNSANGAPPNSVMSPGAIFVNPYQPGNLYVTDLGTSQIKVSIDHGTSWQVDNQLTMIANKNGTRGFGCYDSMCSLQQMLFFIDRPELRIAILTPYGLAVSHDSGANWASLSDYLLDGMPGIEKLSDLLAYPYSAVYEENPVNGLGTLYLALRGRGVVRVDGVY